MKRTSFFILLIALIVVSCSEVLEVGPRGTLNESQIANAENAEGFVIAAYSQLGNDEINRAWSMWQYGNVRSDDAYKGGGGINDGDVFHFMETFVSSQPNQWNYNGIWVNIYIGIRRANDGLRILNRLTESEFPLLNQRKAELRFLRGYWYLMLENLFKNIPYIDETVPPTEYQSVRNDALGRDQILDKIAQDFEHAAEVLPATQAEIGRANKWAAYAFLAKTRLFQAYEQDETHAVINVNQQKLQQALLAADQVIANSGYGLEADFAHNFLPGQYENGIESIMAVQFSTNDGAGRGRVNHGTMLTVPQGIGCCDFQKPSQSLVNAFRTTTSGVPLLEDFSNEPLDFNQHTVDPRLDHTISRPGAPWKYEPHRVSTEAWSRNITLYGTNHSMKENVSPDCSCFINVAPFFGNTMNRILIRFAEVLLIKSEALVEMGRHNEALPIINSLRERAANSTTLLVRADGQPTSNYNIQPYIDGQNITWNQEMARRAVRFERRLELALEGSRFFDLVRWGIAEDVMDAFFEKEREFRTIYTNANFTTGRDEYLPIPQQQIFLSENLYKQNPKY